MALEEAQQVQELGCGGYDRERVRESRLAFEEALEEARQLGCGGSDGEREEKGERRSALEEAQQVQKLGPIIV